MHWLWYYWPAWLFCIALTFAIPEFLAFKYGGPTFSFFMWTTTIKWPLWGWIWGALMGGLAVHFWWHWNPPGTV